MALFTTVCCVVLYVCMPLWQRSLVPAARMSHIGNAHNHRSKQDLSSLSNYQEVSEQNQSLMPPGLGTIGGERRLRKQFVATMTEIGLSFAVNAPFLTQLFQKDLTAVLRGAGYGNILVDSESSISAHHVGAAEMQDGDEPDQAVKLHISKIKLDLPKLLRMTAMRLNLELNVHLTSPRKGDFVEVRVMKITIDSTSTENPVVEKAISFISGLMLHTVKVKRFPRNFIVQGRADSDVRTPKSYDSRIVKLGTAGDGNVGFCLLLSRRGKKSHGDGTATGLSIPFHQFGVGSRLRSQAAIFFDLYALEFLGMPEGITESFVKGAQRGLQLPLVSDIFKSSIGGGLVAKIVNGLLNGAGITKRSQLQDVQIKVRHSGPLSFSNMVKGFRGSQQDRYGTYIILDSTNGGLGILSSMFPDDDLNELISEITSSGRNK